MGAGYPYRKSKVKREENIILDKNGNYSVYSVYPLPQSLFCYIFNFGFINENDEKDYIYFMIEKLFEKDEKQIHLITCDIIYKCHKFLRQIFDYSVVSLRDINRFIKLFEFFNKYFLFKEEFFG